jgi:hypothetical protein
VHSLGSIADGAPVHSPSGCKRAAIARCFAGENHQNAFLRFVIGYPSTTPAAVIGGLFAGDQPYPKLSALLGPLWNG